MKKLFSIIMACALILGLVVPASAKTENNWAKEQEQYVLEEYGVPASEWEALVQENSLDQASWELIEKKIKYRAESILVGNMDTPICMLYANPTTKAVMEKEAPDLSFLSKLPMSFNQLGECTVGMVHIKIVVKLNAELELVDPEKHFYHYYDIPLIKLAKNKKTAPAFDRTYEGFSDFIKTGPKWLQEITLRQLTTLPLREIHPEPFEMAEKALEIAAKQSAFHELLG